MTELEMCDTLGIIVDPDQNRLTMTEELRTNIELLSLALEEVHQQKSMFGTINTDLWLEFIPWHSIN